MNRRSFLKSSSSALAVASLPLAPLASALFAQTAPHAGRELDADWEFYRGPLDGHSQVWHSEELVIWESVTLPHCFNHYDGCDPDQPAYRGQGWYRTKLQIANPHSGGRTLLHFEGAGQSAEVWIGATRIASHVGGYDEWMVDITEACHMLPTGQPMQLAILCDNGRDIERMPSDQSDFTLYGGLYRPVHLVYVPPVSLERVHTRIIFAPGQTASVTVTAGLYAPVPPAGPLKCEITVLDPAGRSVHTHQLTRAAWPGETELTSFQLPHPELWAPNHPSLYRCKVSVHDAGEIASSVHRFGIRHTRFEDHGPFFLNGHRLLLCGTQRHEDHAGFASAMPAELIRQEMQLMKAMGANMVRLGHYQQRSLVLELCDELGLFVWEETPWCRSGIVDDKFRELGKSMLRNMIDQHGNHPSVLIWGIGNEDDWPTEVNGDDHEAIRRYMTELRDLAHSLDPTRLTGYRRGDFVKDIPDVYSPSIWAGWYSGLYTDYAAALEKAHTQVPHMLHVEWGADSHAGRFAEESDHAVAQVASSNDPAEKGLAYKATGGEARVSRDGSWSESYACDLFEWYLMVQESTPWLAGSLQWIFKDFTTPLRVENPVPRVNQKGLLTRDMRPKEGYYVFQSWWSTQPMLRIFGHNWPLRWGSAEQTRLVRVYSNCAEVELFVNGVSKGRRRRNPKDFPCAGLRWNVPFRDGSNELRAIAHTNDGKQIIDTVAFRYETRPWGAPAKLRLAIAGNKDKVFTIEAELVDANGVRCLDSRLPVRFGFAGEGRMLDNLGTPTGSRVVQLYNGRAELSFFVERAGVASVSAKDLAPAFLNLG